MVIKKISILFIRLFNLIIIFFNNIYNFFKFFIYKLLNRYGNNSNTNSYFEKDGLFQKRNDTLKPGKLFKESIEPKFNFEKNSDYELPKLDLLEGMPKNVNTKNNNKDLLQKNALLLENVVKQFNIDAKVVGINPGPVVTLYELAPAPGSQTKKIINLTDDIARSMSAESARISNVKSKNAVGS